MVIFYRNIIKDESSDEESPVTVEDSLKINNGNNQAIDYDAKVSYSNRINLKILYIQVHTFFVYLE